MLSSQIFALAALTLLSPVSADFFGVAPYMGDACKFLVFGSSAITFGAAGHYDGNIGISPTTINAVTIPPGIQPVPGTTYYTAYPQVAGVVHGPGMLANKAHADMLAAYTEANNESPSSPTDSIEPVLDGMAFLPGVYRWSSEVALGAGATVSLNGAFGSVFIFQIGSTLNTGADSKVILNGGVTPDSIYWVTGTSLGMGARSAFQGIVLTGSTAIVGANSNIKGSIYAQSAVTIGADVTMSNVFSDISCPALVQPTATVAAAAAATFSANAAATAGLGASQGATKARRAKAEAPRWDREVARNASRAHKAARRAAHGIKRSGSI
ncbi:hypothetical protein RQP46_005955 [Phenoliferia psychrophenolica]